MIDTSRSSAMIPDILKDFSVAVLGAGSIGSNVVHMLVSMGITDITVYDFDVVEPGNLSPAFFSKQHLFETKLDALKTDIDQRFGVEIKIVPGMIESDTEIDQDYDVVVIGLDNMTARRNSWMVFQRHWRLWIDAAMGGVQMSVESFTMHDSTDNYARALGRPDTALPCGEKAFQPLTKGILVGMIALSIWRWAKGLPPISTSFDADAGYFFASTPDGYGTIDFVFGGQYEPSDSIG